MNSSLDLKKRAIVVVSRVVAAGLALIAGSALANETITYTYDARGRLTQVQVTGGVSNGVQQTYQYDAAGNRTLPQTTGSPNPPPP